MWAGGLYCPPHTFTKQKFEIGDRHGPDHDSILDYVDYQYSGTADAPAWHELMAAHALAVELGQGVGDYVVFDSSTEYLMGTYAAELNLSDTLTATPVVLDYETTACSILVTDTVNGHRWLLGPGMFDTLRARITKRRRLRYELARAGKGAAIRRTQEDTALRK